MNKHLHIIREDGEITEIVQVTKLGVGDVTFVQFGGKVVPAGIGEVALEETLYNKRLADSQAVIDRGK